MPDMTSVVLPTYNERENITALVERIDSLGIVDEIIVVDDRSPDKTAAVARALKPSAALTVIERSGKLGLASAIIDGIRASHGNRIVVMDADQSHDPSIIPRLVAAIQAGADIAIGSRFAFGGGIVGWPIRRQAMSWLATRVARTLFRVAARDPMSGYFAIQRGVFERVRPLLRPRGYKILLELLVRGAPLRTEEIGYVFQDRKYGKSKLSWTIAREYLAMILALLFHKPGLKADDHAD